MADNALRVLVADDIASNRTIVGAFLPGVAVAMLLGRFWKRVNWQGGLACIGSGTLLGVLILVLPQRAGHHPSAVRAES